MTARFLRTAAVAVAALLLQACATTGQDYPVGRSAELKPGETTAEQVQQLLGTPASREASTYKKDWRGRDLPSPIVVEVLRWSYGKPIDNGVLPGVQPTRWATVMLSDGVVIAYYASSSFPADATNSDPAGAAKIAKGLSTEADVIRVLGQPSGRGGYPMASPGGKLLTYFQDLVNHPAGSITKKRIWVQIDNTGLVEDFTVRSDQEAMPLPPPSATPVYVYIPPPKSRK